MPSRGFIESLPPITRTRPFTTGCTRMSVWRCLRRLVLRPRVAGHVWGQQSRWVHWCAEVFPNPLVAPARPLVMSLWVLLGVTTVRRLSSPTFVRVYIDDRTLVSDDPAKFADSLSGWSQWAQSAGLRENVDKVVALAKGIRRGQQLARHLPESMVFFFTSIFSGWRMETFITNNCTSAF